MRLGIGSYTFTWAIGVPGHLPPAPLNALQLLDRAVGLGVKVVQFCDNLPLTQLDRDNLRQFEERVQAHQLEIEIGTRGLDPDNLRSHLKLAQRFHSPILRVVIDRPGDEPSAAEAVRRLRPLLPEFASARVKIALENHDRFPAPTLARMVEDLGPEVAGICLDTVNSFGALEGPDVVLQHLARFALCVHVKDFVVRRMDHQMGFVVEGCATGQGRLDVPWLLAELRAAGRDCNAILELWTSPAAHLSETLAREQAWASLSIQFLRTLIPE